MLVSLHDWLKTSYTCSLRPHVSVTRGRLEDVMVPVSLSLSFSLSLSYECDERTTRGRDGAPVFHLRLRFCLKSALKEP